MKKSFLRSMFCRYIHDQVCLKPPLCLGKFLVISWDKKAQEKYCMLLWQNQ